MSALEEARTLLAGALQVPVDAVGEDTRIGTIEAWDSLGHMRLLMEIEARLGRELDPGVAVEVESVGDVARLIGNGAS